LLATIKQWENGKTTQSKPWKPLRQTTINLYDVLPRNKFRQLAVTQLKQLRYFHRQV